MIDNNIRAYALWRHASNAVVWGDPIDAGVLEHIATADLTTLFQGIAATDFEDDEDAATEHIKQWCSQQTVMAADEGRLSPT